MMNHAKFRLAIRCALSALLLVTATGAISQTAQSKILVGSPANGTQISSPVLVRAHNTGCGGARPNYFGYSIDDDGAIIPGDSSYDIDVLGQSLPVGVHTLHFRSWTSLGECPATSTTFTVTETSSAPSIPPYAITSVDLDTQTRVGKHDKGTPGTSKGLTIYPATTPVYDNAREFFMTYTKRAGERWSTSVATKDTASTHFVLDLYVLFPKPSEVLNLELDLNQVVANGDTVLMTTQCSGSKKVWEYGITKNGRDTWTTSTLPCNPATWTANTWHHIQIGMHHDNNGYVTHDWVTLDDVYTPFTNAVSFSEKALHWAKGHVTTQFQMEGSSKTSGSTTAFVHNMIVYRW